MPKKRTKKSSGTTVSFPGKADFTSMLRKAKACAVSPSELWKYQADIHKHAHSLDDAVRARGGWTPVPHASAWRAWASVVTSLWAVAKACDEDGIRSAYVKEMVERAEYEFNLYAKELDRQGIRAYAKTSGKKASK